MSEKHADPALPAWLTVGFTGHRALTDPDKVTAALGVALDRLAAYYPHMVGVSSAASGGDTLFAEEMLRRHCPIAVILPFPCERFSQDFADDPKGWERSKRVMLAAMDLSIISQSELDRLEIDVCTSLQNLEAEKKRLTNAAYMEAGVRTVERADLLIAVWDQEPGKGLGGTADTIKYARAIGKPVIIINPVTGEQQQERIDTMLRTADSQKSISHELPPRSIVENYFKAAERDADKHAPRARNLIRWSLRLNLTVSVVGTFGIVYDLGYAGAVAIGSLGLVVLVAASLMLASRGISYKRWLQRRAEAEICRSFLATWNIRRHATAGHEPHPPLPGLSNLFASLRLLRQMDRTPLGSFEQIRDNYANQRLQDQLGYFKDKLEQVSRSYKFHDKLMKGCSWLAVLCSVVVLTFTVLGLFATLTKFLLFVAVSLPLVTTAVVLMVITDESSRRYIRYGEMVMMLEHYEPLLLASVTWDSLARIATGVEAELLQELVEWRSFVRHTEELH